MIYENIKRVQSADLPSVLTDCWLKTVDCNAYAYSSDKKISMSRYFCLLKSFKQLMFSLVFIKIIKLN